MPAFKDITGQRFGRLVVSNALGPNKHGQNMWSCACDCGNTTKVMIGHLTEGHTQSCGCLQKETRIKHGRCSLPGSRGDRVYQSWVDMNSRCSNPRSKNWPYYGGRGIQVCERWKGSFESFIADMGEPPTRKHTIDRIDNDGNYEPNNCRWATQIQQARNTSKNRILEFKGEKKCVSAFAEQYGLTKSCVLFRLNRGWTVEQALTTPSNNRASIISRHYSQVHQSAS